MHALNQIFSLIIHYGYLVILLGVMAESTGIPLPGETILIAAGIMAQRGSLDVGDAILFGIIGTIIGNEFGYFVGRKGGRPFILRWGKYVKITPQRLGHAERFFERHGGKAVFFARFFAGLRVFGALVAGMSRMRAGTFLLYNVLGGAVWATAAVLAGYLLGGSIGLLERWAGRATILLAVLVALGVILYLAYRWINSHPEQTRRILERLGGRRLQTFLQTPAGLWLVRRFSPREVYGLALTSGLVFAGLFSWAFGSIAEDILSRDPLVHMDLAILRFAHSHSEAHLTTAAIVLDNIFAPEVVLPAGVLAGVVLLILGLKRRDFQNTFSGVVLAAAAFGTGVLAELFKFIFHRPRPPLSLQLVHETGNTSFPSAHAMAAVAVGAAVWYLFSIRPPGKWAASWQAKARAGLVVIAISLLVGLGRVYVGAHYPSDVLAGWTLGGVWASLYLTAAEIFRRLHGSKTNDNDRASDQKSSSRIGVSEK